MPLVFLPSSPAHTFVGSRCKKEEPLEALVEEPVDAIDKFDVDNCWFRRGFLDLARKRLESVQLYTRFLE